MLFRRSAKRSSDIESIESLETLDRLFETSHQRPVWILKHSTLCGVSFAALRECKRFVAQATEKGAENGDAPKTFAMIKIREQRDLSDALAERTGIRHESPQLFLLDHGEVAWSASHWGITVAALDEALAAYAAPSSLPTS